MNYLKQDLAIAQIIALMTSYSFDTNQKKVEELVQEWQKKYNAHWIYLATIEALYLGRYKAISIEQLMHSWSRIGQPNTHFGGDFERLISRKLPRHLSTLSSLKKEKTEAKQFNPENSSTAKLKTQGKSNLPEICFSNTSIPQHNLENKSHLSVTQNPLISTQVTPLPEGKVISANSSKPPSLIKKVNTTTDNQPQKKGIATFQPLPDASGFFQKLKALADNQRKKEQKD